MTVADAIRTDKSLSFIRKLVKNGANVNYVDKDKSFRATPLMLACNRGKLHLVKFLVKNGANINYATSDRQTAFMVAYSSHSSVVAIRKFLLKSGVNISKFEERYLDGIDNAWLKKYRPELLI